MYVKLSWRPEVDRKLSYNGCTVSNFDLPQIAFWPWTEGQRLKFNNITPSHLSHPVDTFSALPSMAVGWCLHVRRGYIVKFPHPMYFSLRRAKERIIRTRPSTVSPRNFVFWFSFLAGGAGTSLRPWTEGQRRYQRGEKGAKGLYC
jgi:hypothetical protein